MLKVFRSIRQKLIIQENVKKYLLYAVGEILLVVIGIIIAIQANNWNIERAKQKELRFELGKVIVNLQLDMEVIQQQMETNMDVITNLDSSLIILKNPDAYSKSHFLTTFFPVNWVVEFNSNKVSYTYLSSTGRLQSIRNPSLIDSLLQYYNSEDYKPVEFAIVNHTRDVIRPYLMGFDFLPVNQTIMQDHNDETAFQTTPKTLDDYAADVRIINGIRFKILLHSVLNRGYQQKMEQAERLIEQIRDEL